MKQTYIYPQTSSLSVYGMFIMAASNPDGTITKVPEVGSGGIGTGTAKMPKKI